jgi:esterase
MPILAHQVLAARSEEPPRTAFVLHGILGQGQNWRTFCRKVQQSHPSWEFVLVDHRGHGASGPFPPPHTVRACAGDLAALAAHLGKVPEVVLGHSFGGKVALWYAREHGGPALRRVEILDSVPQAAGPDPEVSAVIASVGEIPVPAESRDEIKARLDAKGLSAAIVAWLLTSVAQSPDGWRFVYDLPAIRAMIADYFKDDLIPWLRERRGGAHVRFVRAERSDRWLDPFVAEIQGLPGNVELVTLPNAGHWLQVDNPTGLLALLDETFGVPRP